MNLPQTVLDIQRKMKYTRRWHMVLPEVCIVLMTSLILTSVTGFDLAVILQQTLLKGEYLFLFVTAQQLMQTHTNQKLTNKF